jgi:hypothetical protein
MQLVSSPTRCTDGTPSVASRRLLERMPRRGSFRAVMQLYGGLTSKNNKGSPADIRSRRAYPRPTSWVSRGEG